MSNSKINQDLIESDDEGKSRIISGSLKLSNKYKQKRQSSFKKLLQPSYGSKSENFLKVEHLVSRTVDSFQQKNQKQKDFYLYNVKQHLQNVSMKDISKPGSSQHEKSVDHLRSFEKGQKKRYTYQKKKVKDSSKSMVPPKILDSISPKSKYLTNQNDKQNQFDSQIPKKKLFTSLTNRVQIQKSQNDEQFENIMMTNSQIQQINYKLMEKRNLKEISEDDIKTLEESIYNIESFLPQKHLQANQKKKTQINSEYIISQKQMVESLEQVLLHSGKQKENGKNNYLYRMILKIHHFFINDYLKHKSFQNVDIHDIYRVETQIQIMINYLNLLIINQKEQQETAGNCYYMCLRQKTFIALLNHMMLQINQRNERQGNISLRALSELSSQKEKDQILIIKKENSNMTYNVSFNEQKKNDFDLVREYSLNSKSSDTQYSNEEVNPLHNLVRLNNQNESIDHSKVNTTSSNLKSILKSNNRSAQKGQVIDSVNNSQERVYRGNVNFSQDLNDQNSPQRDITRRLEKEQSPVRAYLNQDEYSDNEINNAKYNLQNQQFNLNVENCYDANIHSKNYENEEDFLLSSEDNQQLPKIIMQTSMFDNKNSSIINNLIKQSQPNEDHLILKKCMDVWKIYVKQQIIERAHKINLDDNLEIKNILNENTKYNYAIAVKYCDDNLKYQAFQGLLKNILVNVQQNNIHLKKMQSLKNQRILKNCFKAWGLLISKMINQRKNENQYLSKWHKKIQKIIIFKLKEIVQNKKKKLIYFQKQQKKSLQKKVFKNVLQKIYFTNKQKQIILKDYLQNKVNQKKLRIFKEICNLNPLKVLNNIDKINEIKYLKLYKLFQNWNEIMQKNKALRQKIIKFQKKYQKQFRISYMQNWIDLTKEEYKAQIYIKKMKFWRFFKVLKKYGDIRKRKYLVNLACIQHLEKIRQKNVFLKLKQFVFLEKQERNFQNKLQNKLDLFKLRRIYKLWFNQIDILKRWRYLNQNTYKWYLRKWMKKIVKGWRRETRLKNSYFKIIDNHKFNLAVRTIKSLQIIANRKRAFDYIQLLQKEKMHKPTIQKIMSNWYMLLNNQLKKRLKFKKRIQFTYYGQVFDKLKQNMLKRKSFKAGLKNLLKMRAKNILRIAYIYGFKKMWHQKQFKNNLYEASLLYSKLRQIKLPLYAFKVSVNFKRKFKIINQKKFKFISKQYMKNWIYVYLGIQNLKKWNKNKLKKSLKILQKYCKEQKYFKRRQLFLKQVQKENQIKLYFKKLKNYCQNRVIKKQRLQYFFQEIYQIQLKKKTFKFLLQKLNNKKLKKQKNQEYMNIHKKYILKMILKVFQFNKILSLKKKKAYQLSKKFLLSKCFQQLQKNQVLKQKIKLILKKQMKYRKALIFDGFVRYCAYKKYFQLKEIQIQFNHQQKLISQVFNQINISKNKKILERKLTSLIKLNKCVIFFSNWHELFQEHQEEREERHLALELFAKHNLQRLRRATQTGKQERKEKYNLWRMQTQFYEYNSKKRGVQMLMKNINKINISKVNNIFAKTVNYKRIFNGWLRVVTLLKRKRILIDSSILMNKTFLLEKSVRALKENADRKIKNRLIIGKFKERSQLAIKADVLLELHANIEEQKSKKLIFYQKLEPFAVKKATEPFIRWIEFIYETRLEKRADKFFKKRKAQYLYRLSWDSLKIYTLESQQVKLQINSIQEWHHNIIKQKTILAFKLNQHYQKKIKSVSSIIQIQNKHFSIQQIFQAFKEGIKISKYFSLLNKRAEKFYKTNIQRKCFISIQIGEFKAQGESQLSKKNKIQIKKQFLLKWFKALVFKKRIESLCQILQKENDSRLIHKFFPRMIKEIYFLQIFDHMKMRREQNYQIEFFNELRKQILLKKILKQYKERNLVEMKRAVFIELRIAAFHQKNHKIVIADRLDNFEKENYFDVLQIAFNCLKERVVVKKFKKISLNCFKIKMKKKCLYALQEYNLKIKIDRKKSEEIQRIQSAKYFWIWREEYLKEKDKNQISKYLQSSFLHQIMQCWKQITHQKLQIQSFYKNVVLNNILKQTFQGWVFRINQKKKMRFCNFQLKKSYKLHAEKQFMEIWMDKFKYNKLNQIIRNNYELKCLSKIYSEWKNLKDKNNQKRINLHYIKLKLQQNPELGRPLKVLKNFLLFKAFSKLCIESHQQYKEEEKFQQADFAYFYQIQKKAFLSLKLKACKNVHKSQTMEMGELFLKKRFLDFLKLGTQVLKKERKMRHKASIFRFLALQKKIFGILIRYSLSVQESRIKNTCSLQLYYKKLIQKGFCSLKVFGIERQKARLERIENQENQIILSNTKTFHSQIQQDKKVVFSPTIISNQNLQSQSFVLINQDTLSDQQQNQSLLKKNSFQNIQNQPNNRYFQNINSQELVFDQDCGYNQLLKTEHSNDEHTFAGNDRLISEKSIVKNENVRNFNNEQQNTDLNVQSSYEQQQFLSLGQIQNNEYQISFTPNQSESKKRGSHTKQLSTYRNGNTNESNKHEISENKNLNIFQNINSSYSGGSAFQLSGDKDNSQNVNILFQKSGNDIFIKSKNFAAQKKSKNQMNVRYQEEIQEIDDVEDESISKKQLNYKVNLKQTFMSVPSDYQVLSLNKIEKQSQP